MIDGFLSTYTEPEFWRDVNVAIVAALILGIVGYILRRFGSTVLNRLLSVITLGNARIKRRIYQRISSLHHSGYGEFITSIVFNATLMALVVLFLAMNTALSLDKVQNLIGDLENTEIRLWDTFEYQEKKPDSSFELLEDINSKQSELDELRKYVKDRIFYSRVLIVLVGLFVIYRYITMTYVHSAQVHFRKILDLCGPYCNEQERLSFVSRFAQIERKEDFEELRREMLSILTDNEIPRPAFIIW